MTESLRTERSTRLAFIRLKDTVARTSGRNASMRKFSECLMLALLVLAPACACADARADVQSAFDKVIEAGGFRAQASGRLFGPDLPAMSGLIEVEFPDRIHARTETTDFIVTPDGAWVRAFGVWAPADPSLLPVTAFDRAAMRKAIASIRDVREEGRAKTAQCPTRVYRFRASGQLPGADAEGDMRVWICETTGRPAHLEAVDTAGDRVRVEFDWSRRARVVAPDD